MLLLGIGGQKSAGKGTVASVVHSWAAERGLLAVERGFADLVKQSVARLFFPSISLPEAVLMMDLHKNDENARITIDLPGLEPTSVTIRQALQHMGTEVGRDLYGRNHWINLIVRDEIVAMRAFAVDNKPADIGIISDVRFTNETSAIRNAHGRIWKVVRPELKSDDGHLSEKTDYPHDLLIVNEGTLDEFRSATYSVIDQVLPNLLKHDELGGHA